MVLHKLFAVVFIFFCSNAVGKTQVLYHPEPLHKKLSFGTEFQAYPAGQMYALRLEYFHNRVNEFNLRLGYNRAFRKDFSGLNDDEQGGGPGATLGYRRHFFFPTIKDPYKFYSSIFFSTRVDIWRMVIFWKDSNHIPSNGTTRITVIQPTFDVGYRMLIKRDLNVSVYAGFGQEINIATKGKAVGQGGLWLGGITACYSF
jgi:hypothetical protein